MPASRENEVGRCRCPVCQSTTARLRVSAKQLAYVTCNTCNSQVFARSDRSDTMLRALHIADAAPPAALPAPTPAPAPAPAAPTPPPPAAKAAGFAWGVLR